MLDEQRLRQLYLVEEQSIRAIAASERVSVRTVYDALMHYHIPRRSPGFRAVQTQPSDRMIDEAELRRLYLDEQRSIRAIAAKIGVSTRVVYDSLMAYRIPRRTSGGRGSLAPPLMLAAGTLDEPILRRLYQHEGRSIVDIAATLQCSPSCIRSALVRWGIERRRRGRPSSTVRDRS
jgi:predicted DNA-binding protein YlxM (UPF0122 family)